jgi:Toprim-like/DNA primase catalytic core, N-terminal domain
MNVGEIVQFLGRLGCEKIYASGKWVKATCPLQYRHNGGRDKSPSFAVSIDPGDMSNCRCLACGVYGDLAALLWRMEADGRRPRPDLFQFLAVHNMLDVERIVLEDDGDKAAPEVGAAKRRKYKPRPPRPSNFVNPDDEPQAEVPEDALKQMIADMTDEVHTHLTQTANAVMGREGRGLSPLTVAEWELGWHPMKRRICIPIRDEDGKLVALSGRAFGKGKPKYLHSRFKRDRILFGEHRRNRTIRTGYLFEGFFQAIYSWQCGYENVFARMGTHLSYQQAMKLALWLDHLIIVPDGDKAGKDAAERDARTLRDLEVEDKDGKVRRLEKIDITDMPRGKDIDNLKPGKVRALLGPRNTA